MSRARTGLAMLALAVLLSAGCIYTRDRTVRLRGYELSQDALASLQKGVTTPADVEKMFGTPAQTLTPEPGRQVLVYHYESNEMCQVSAFVVYHSGTNVTHASTYRFEFKDGLLTGYKVESTG